MKISEDRDRRTPFLFWYWTNFCLNNSYSSCVRFNCLVNSSICCCRSLKALANGLKVGRAARLVPRIVFQRVADLFLQKSDFLIANFQNGLRTTCSSGTRQSPFSQLSGWTFVRGLSWWRVSRRFGHRFEKKKCFLFSRDDHHEGGRDDDRK